jgi:photosystem II stability/assembly factor-like uncharacterized protein
MELAVAHESLNSGGVQRSTDGGRTWSIEAVPPTRYSAVAYAADGTLYALSTGPTTVAQEGLYRRNVNGTWVGLGPDQGPLYESELGTIAADPQAAAVLLVGGADFGSVQGTEGAIWRTTDGGTTWSRRFEGEPRKVIIDIEHSGGDVAVATFDDRDGTRRSGALRSPNRGIDWTGASDGLPAASRLPLLCTAPSGRLWLSIYTGPASLVFRSDDGGISWQGGSSSGQEVRAIACDPSDERRLFLGISRTPWVLRSRDGATSFESWGQGLAPLAAVRTLAVGHGHLLLGSARGIHRSPPLDLVFVDGFDAPQASR